MSSYQADWLIDEEGNAINDSGSENGGDNEDDGEDNEDNDDEDEDDEEDDDMEEQKSEKIEIRDLNQMLPPSGLPKAYTNALDSNSILDEDDITLDGSILTANMPTKKELQVIIIFIFVIIHLLIDILGKKKS